MTIVYGYGTNLYVNVTNRCSCSCEFCIRTKASGVGDAGGLWLEREPTKEEILADILKRDLEHCPELVFCGYGEPSIRWDDIAWVIDRLPRSLRVRMNTNGHGSVLCGRDITQEMKGRLSGVSVSLNCADEAHYKALVHPDFNGAFEAMQDFTRSCVKAGIDTSMTVVDCIPPEEIERCRILCGQLGAKFRVREYAE